MLYYVDVTRESRTTALTLTEAILKVTGHLFYALPRCLFTWGFLPRFGRDGAAYSSWSSATDEQMHSSVRCDVRVFLGSDRIYEARRGNPTFPLCMYDICDVDIDMLRIEAHHIRISIYTLPIDECPISSLRGATGRDGDGDPAYGHGH